MANQEKRSLKINYQERINSGDKIGQNATDKPELPVNEGLEGKAIATNVENNEYEAIFKINSCDAIQNKLTDKPPQVIYKSSSKSKHRLSKKAKYYKHVTKLKKSNKHSNQRKMNKKLERYIHGKVTSLSKDTNQITAESLSTIASSCPMLKQVPAKESLIEDSNSTIENIDENNGDHTPSLCSANSIISNFSQKTITFKIGIESSETLNVNGSSVMFLLDQPIKQNVINIARAQVDNISFGAMKSFDTLIGEANNEDAFTHHAPRVSTPYSTSIETIGHSSDQGAFLTSSEPSSVTLVDENKKVQQFTEDNNNRFYQSNLNMLSNSDITLRMQHLNMNESSENYSRVPLSNTKQTLMDTVNDLGMFPEMTPQRSANNFNDVIVAERLITSFNPLVKETNERQKDKYNQNNETKSVVKSLNNAAKLEKLLNKGATDDICKSDEYKWRNGNPSSIAELWEKLAEALDLKVQKLEKSLTDTILSEMKESYSVLEKFKKLVDAEKDAKVVDIEKNINKLLNKLDEDLQCNLINEPTKPNSTEIALSSVFLKDTKGVQYKFEPSFEILKPVVKSAGDSQDFIGIVVDKPMISPAPRDHHRPPFAAVRYFFKENSIVLAGTPVFLGTIICIYFIVVLMLNWA